MADPFSSTLPGVACDPARGIHFSIENLREIPGLSEAERQHRRRAMKALFGFLTYERIASEFRASVAPFYYLMDHSEAMDIGDFVAKLLNEWPARSTSPPTWEPKHKLSPLDVFSLPFRHLVLNETLEVLSLHYGIAESTASLYLHNSAVMLSIFWAPNYFFFPTNPSDIRKWTVPSVLTSADVAELYLLVLADNSELMSTGSLNLLLQLYLYSFKLEHAHSLKLFIACLSKGLIVYRPPLFGGSTPEITPLGHFLRSAELRELRQKHTVTLIDCAVDMGFTAASPEEVKAAGVTLVFPSRHVGGQRLPMKELLLKEVCVVLIHLLTSLQAQQSLRHTVEMRFDVMKVHRSFAHAGITYRALPGVELYADILCAVANMQLLCPLDHAVVYAHLGAPIHGLTRAKFFLQLYAPPAAPLCFPASPPPLTPDPSRILIWKELLRGVPHESARIYELLKKHNDELRRQCLVGCSEKRLVPAIPEHHFPSSRAVALFEGHFVLLLEFACTDTEKRTRECAVQAHVHGSERSSSIYYPRVKWTQREDASGFSFTEVWSAAPLDLTAFIREMRSCPLVQVLHFLTARHRRGRFADFSKPIWVCPVPLNAERAQQRLKDPSRTFRCPRWECTKPPYTYRSQLTKHVARKHHDFRLLPVLLQQAMTDAKVTHWAVPPGLPWYPTCVAAEVPAPPIPPQAAAAAKRKQPT